VPQVTPIRQRRRTIRLSMMRPPLLLLLLALTGPALAGVVDRVVMVVEDELVLESDIRLEAVLTSLDDAPLPFWRRDHDDPERRLEEAALIRALAAGVLLYQPQDSEVADRVARVRARLGSDEAWVAFRSLWGLDEAAVTGLVRRRMIVERYLLRNLPEDPENTERWLAACHALLDEVRPRYRIRRVPQRGER
jgi:hypothetical protein